jgi:hypothetical protein
VTRVEVTADDIRRGRRYECRYCPVALALNRATGEAWEVGPRFAWTHRGGPAVPLPPAAAAFVDRFDIHGRGDPFSFDLEVPTCATPST